MIDSSNIVEYIITTEGIDYSKTPIIEVMVNHAIKSIKRYINSQKYTDEVIIEKYDDIIIELTKRAYDNYKHKDSRVIQSKTQGQRSITYKDDLRKSPYEITTDIAKLLPGPFINVL